jgi:hypothetical protein
MQIGREQEQDFPVDRKDFLDDVKIETAQET